MPNPRPADFEYALDQIGRAIRDPNPLKRADYCQRAEDALERIFESVANTWPDRGNTIPKFADDNQALAFSQMEVQRAQTSTQDSERFTLTVQALKSLISVKEHCLEGP